jgi:hypothetical protein
VTLKLIRSDGQSVVVEASELREFRLEAMQEFVAGLAGALEGESSDSSGSRTSDSQQ